MNRSPSYVIQRPSGWYFCLNIPADVRPFVNQSQLRYPLKTRLISLAKHRALYIATHCKALFNLVRAGDMKSLNEEDIKQMVAQWLREALELSEEARIEHGPYNSEAQAEEVRDLERFEQTYRSALGRRDYSSVEVQAERLLQEGGYVIDKGSFAFKKLCRELIKAGIVFAQTEQKRAKGEFDEELPPIPSAAESDTATAPSSKQSKTSESSLTISELFTEYEKDMNAGKRWLRSTGRANEAMMRNMVEILGDLPVADMDKAVGRKFKAGLQSFPVNRTKHPDYREKTLDEINALPKVKSISVVTVNNRLARAKGMFRWGLDNGYVQVNPYEGLSVPTSSRARDQVLPFDKTELKTIFGSPLYRENTYRKPYQYWLPLLGLFTGARIEELCQLHLEDIRQVKKIWCLDINDGPGRSLKNLASKRILPIHPELIRLGFLQFADRLRAAGKTRLFPELGRVNGKYSHYPSISFGKFKKGLGFPSRTKAFHSFRHLMTEKLRETQTEDYLIKMLLGHSAQSVTHDVYGGGQEVKPLFEVLRRVDFGVDLGHLKFKP